MIGYLTGTVLDTSDKRTIINVGGVGYVVYATERTLEICLVGMDTSLYIHTIVREQALDLYGFSTLREQELFELLITISGIGPKVALGILNATTVENLIQAVLKKESSVLTKVSGIGKKNAEKIILELENKIDESWKEAGARDTDNEDLEVFEALEALGYRSRDIQEILKDSSLEGLDTSGKVRKAIKLLSK
ncbi:MAG: Holliday junction branch migration protein RuvA [Patescibacteria group bacterium]